MANNPGVSAAGQAIGAAQRQIASGTSVSGGNKFAVDSTDLATLHTRLQVVTSDIANLDRAVGSLVSNLQKAGKAIGAVTGGTGSSSSGAGLTTAPVSGGSNPTRGGGGSPSTITPASVSFLGKAAGVLSMGAMGEFAASAAGAVNGYMGGISSGGIPINLMASQANAIMGQGTGFGSVAKTSSTITAAIPSFSQADTASALSVMQANAFLRTPRGSQQQKNLYGFMKSSEGIVPSMGASGAAQFANTLGSAGAMQMANRYLGAGNGILVNANGTYNSPQQTFANIMKIMVGNASWANDPLMLKSLATQNSFWAKVNQSFGPGTPMNLTPTELTAMQQYAAAGGSVTGAVAAMKNTGAAAALAKTSGVTNLNQSLYQSGIQAQNNINRMEGAAANQGAGLAQSNPGLVNTATYMAKAGTAALTLAGHLAVLDAVVKVLTGGSILSKLGIGGAGAGATTATDVTETAAGGGALAAGGVVAGSALAGYVGARGAMALGNKYQYSKGITGVAARGVYQATSQKPYVTPSGLRHGIAAGYDKIDHALFGWMGDPATGSTTTAGMTSTMSKRVGAMMAANPNLKISSGHRTAAQQAYLYKAKGGRGVARPGNSAHQTGQAADLGPPSQFGWIAKNASKFGLSRPDPSGEPWHVQAMGDPVSSPVGAGLTRGRTDQGVDYSGKGPVYAAASGVIISTTNSGWNMGGAGNVGTFIAIRLDKPVDALHSVIYYAEDITPTVSVGQHVSAGQQIGMATGGPSGIEIGWGNPKAIGSALADGASGATSAGQDFLKWISGATMSGGGTSAGGSSSSGSNSTTGQARVLATSLANTFIGGISGSWLSGGGPAGAGAPSSASTPVAASSASGTGSSTSNSLSTTPTSTGYLSAKQVYDLAVGAGLGAHAAQIATAVAKMESGFNPQAVDLDSNGTTDYGLWQINSVHPGVGTNMFNPTTAAAEMAKLSNNGNNWGAWGPDFGGSYGYTGPPMPGSKVASAMQALGFMGDPTGGGGGMPGFSGGMGSMGGGVARVSGGGGSLAGAKITLSMPLQVVGVSQQDAQKLAQMVLSELKSQAASAAVGD